MSENRFWAAFGLEEPKAEAAGQTAPEAGENVQETAEPATQTTTAGENGQEVAAPAEAEVEQMPENEQEADAPGEMSAEERHQQAAARRQRESAAMEEQIRARVQQEQDQQIRELLAGMDLTDPETGEKVTTLEGYRKIQKAQREAALARELKEGKLTEAGLETALANHPKIKRLIDNAEAAEKEAFYAERETQLAEIRKLNVNVKTLTDIIQMPTGQEFISYVGKGMSYLDAYRLANFKDITAKARAAGEQAARNGNASKAHMQPQTGGGNAPATVVTEALRQKYRRFNPGITDAEIAAAEKRYK